MREGFGVGTLGNGYLFDTLCLDRDSFQSLIVGWK